MTLDNIIEDPLSKPEVKENPSSYASEILRHEAYYTPTIIPQEHALTIPRPSSTHSARDYGIGLTGIFEYELGSLETYRPDIIYTPNMLYALNKMKEDGKKFSPDKLREYFTKSGFTTVWDIRFLGKANTFYGYTVGDIYRLNAIDKTYEAVAMASHPGLTYGAPTAGDEGVNISIRNPKIELASDYSLENSIKDVNRRLSPAMFGSAISGLTNHGVLPLTFDIKDENGEYQFIGLKQYTIPLTWIPAPEPDHNKRGTDIFEYLLEWGEKHGKNPPAILPEKNIIDTLVTYMTEPISPSELEAIKIENYRLPKRYQNLIHQAKLENKLTDTEINLLANEAFFDNRHVRGEVLTHEGFFWQIAEIAVNEDPRDPLKLAMVADLEVKNENKKGRLHGNEKMRNIANHIKNTTDFDLRAATQMGGSYLLVAPESQLTKLQESIKGDSEHNIALSIDEENVMHNVILKLKGAYYRNPEKQNWLEQKRLILMDNLFNGAVVAHKPRHYLQEMVTAIMRLPQNKSNLEVLTLLEWIYERYISRFSDLIKILDENENESIRDAHGLIEGLKRQEKNPNYFL